MDAEAALWARGWDSRWSRGRRVEEALSLPSPWAETSREGGSTEAGGSAARLGRGLEAAVEVVRMLGDEVAYL